jgi:putative transposase
MNSYCTSGNSPTSGGTKSAPQSPPVPLTIHRAFKFQLKLTRMQELTLFRYTGACRFIYNKALALEEERFKNNEKRLTFIDLCKDLTKWRHAPETVWLSELSTTILRGSLKAVDRAYINFFQKRSKHPRFKKRGEHDSFVVLEPTDIKVDHENSRVSLPRIGWLRYRNSREVTGEPRTAGVSREGKKWYVSIVTQQEVEQPVHPSTTSVGLDVGIANFATLSDGTVFEPVNSYAKHERRLAMLQRRMSRKKKFSKNWYKAKERVEVLHRKIRNTRQNFLHTTSAQITQQHATIFVEDLAITNMSKSAAGTIEEPGKNVAAKAGLNKSILDQGWGEFRRQLEYKEKWKGGDVVAVPPQYTSQTCPLCGFVSSENRKTQEKFNCVSCGFKGNADVVAATNILAAGYAVEASGEDVQ